MSKAARLTKLGAMFFAVVILTSVSISDNTQAQKGASSGGRGSSGRPILGGGFGRHLSSFGGRAGFRGGFDRSRRDFGPNIVVVPSVISPPSPYYGAPSPPYYSLRCVLHRRVETPNGSVLEPVYVC